MGMAESRVAEIVGNQAGIYVKTTETRPTLSESEMHTVCHMIDDTLKTVTEMWVWSGFDWYKY